MTRNELLLFGERIRNRRDELGFTQEYAAEKVGVTTRYYQMIERGEKTVSLDTIIKLSRALTISIDFLLFGNVAYSMDNPIVNLLERLSPVQRADALKIFQIYANACNG